MAHRNERVQQGTGKVEYNSPEATEAIDRFVQSTDVEFECSKIVEGSSRTSPIMPVIYAMEAARKLSKY